MPPGRENRRQRSVRSGSRRRELLTIGGGFSVEEVTAARITLVNDRCPFGEAVRRAPALCRMTSSVFGGIAARNTGLGAAVVSEERIAVGDPQCRVVVWLDVEEQSAQHAGHRYEPV